MGSKMRWAAGIVIALLALVLAFAFPYSLVSEYGGSTALGSALVGLIAAPAVAFGGWLMFRRGPWTVTGGLALGVAAALTGGLLGQATHDRVARTVAGACSADERSELEALGAVRTNGEYGSGSSDGSCRAAFGGRTPSSLEELREVIEGRGWQPEGAEAYTRESKRLRIEVTDEGDKGLDIVLNFPS